MSLTADYVRSLLRYDPETGIFTRIALSPNSRRADGLGKPTGSLRPNGYVAICIDNKLLFAHRLAWLMVHGYMPKCIDHINGNPADNRLCNLREATKTQNQANQKRRSDNTSGIKGVHWYKRGGCWRAHINIAGKNTYLGSFQDKEAAQACYAAAAAREFGEFARLA